MKKIKNVVLVLENCECILIPAEAVENFNYSATTCKKQALINLQMTISKHPKVENLLLPSTPMDCLIRLDDYRDITQVHINYNDNTKNEFWVYWEDDKDYNQYQKTYFDDNGMLHIQIDYK